MTSADQIKALLNSYIEKDDDRFTSIAYQVAAHEARKGHGKLAQDIKKIIEKAQKNKSLGAKETSKSSLIPTSSDEISELLDLLSFSTQKIKLKDMVLNSNVANKLKRIIHEQQNVEKLSAHGLYPRQKLLLTGFPGTGKTMTAKAIAGELNLPLYSVRLDGLISKYMGETITKLKLIFDSIQMNRAVYLFDEFDSIGSKRLAGNDVGEIKRVLNSFLMLIEEVQTSSLIIAATNHAELLDKALFRRFDDVINFDLPQKAEIKKLIKSRIGVYLNKSSNLEKISEACKSLSHSELTRACDDSIKNMILSDKNSISEKDIIQIATEKQSFSLIYRLSSL